MKAISKFCMIIGVAGTLLAGCASRESFTVRERPAEVTEERPAPPYEGAVWIPGEWVWRGGGEGGYQHTHGHYVHASNRVWVTGSWRQVTGGGYAWDKGHWQK